MPRPVSPRDPSRRRVSLVARERLPITIKMMAIMYQTRWFTSLQSNNLTKLTSKQVPTPPKCCINYHSQSSTALNCSAKVFPWNWFSKPEFRQGQAGQDQPRARCKHIIQIFPQECNGIVSSTPEGTSRGACLTKFNKHIGLIRSG